MSPKARYWLAVSLILLTLVLLYPGLTQNALTIRAVPDVPSVGLLVRNEITKAQIPPETMAKIRPYLREGIFGKFDDKELSDFIGRLGEGLVMGKLEGAQEYFKAHPPYEQKQTIVVTIRYLFENGGYTAATLLLLFSVCVPIGKVLLFFWALHTTPERREKLLSFINWIGKWSMADVYVVAIYTAYLGARSSVGVGQPLHFETEYGPGFYWFAAYCVVSLASQQVATSLMRDWRKTAV
jgi:hypothetical protein